MFIVLFKLWTWASLLALAKSIYNFTQEEAILTSKQARVKLQCLYELENVMSNNFRKTHVLEKNGNYKLKLHSKGFY